MGRKVYSRSAASSLTRLVNDILDIVSGDNLFHQFVMYYFTLLFLLCFATPVLITTSLNVYISSAVRGTVYSNISNHQWLTLAACVLMWLPCLTERMLSKMGLLADRLSVSVFLFLLGHTHNLLR